MPEYPKLDKAGDTVTLQVTRVKLSETGKWPVWKLGGTRADGVEVVVDFPASSMARELEFLKISSGLELNGKTVIIARSTKLAANGNPYWNIGYATLPEGGPRPTRVTQEQSGGTGFPAPDAVVCGHSHYQKQEWQRKWHRIQYHALFDALNAHVPDKAIAQAMAATLWIGFQKANLLDVPPQLPPEVKATVQDEQDWANEQLSESDNELPF